MPGAAGPHAAGRRRAATLAAALAVAVSLATPERAAACTLTTTGAATVDDGVLFTLTLGAANTGDGLPTSWKISWGDGAIQTFNVPADVAAAGGPVTHTYAARGTPSIFTYNILASAVCGGKTYFQNKLVVPSAEHRRAELVRPQRDHEPGRDRNTGAERAERWTGLSTRRDRRTGRKRLRQRMEFGKRQLRYNPTTGAFIDEFAAGGGGFAAGMAFGRDGHLYVADRDLGTVRRYHGTTGAFMGNFVTAGLGGID